MGIKQNRKKIDLREEYYVSWWTFVTEIVAERTERAPNLPLALSSPPLADEAIMLTFAENEQPWPHGTEPRRIVSAIRYERRRAGTEREARQAEEEEIHAGFHATGRA